MLVMTRLDWRLLWGTHAAYLLFISPVLWYVANMLAEGITLGHAFPLLAFAIISLVLYKPIVLIGGGAVANVFLSATGPTQTCMQDVLEGPLLEQGAFGEHHQHPDAKVMFEMRAHTVPPKVHLRVQGHPRPITLTSESYEAMMRALMGNPATGWRLLGARASMHPHGVLIQRPHISAHQRLQGLRALNENTDRTNTP